MAVAEMKKFNLVAMSYDKDALFDAMQRTGAVEVKMHGAAEHTVVPVSDAEELRARYSRAEEALEKLLEGISGYERQNKVKNPSASKKPEISYSEFMSAGGREATTAAEEAIDRIGKLFAERGRLL